MPGSEETDKIAWHPAFACAMKLELKDARPFLSFETEYELNRQPLRMDLLIIKKPPEVAIASLAGSHFRGHNIIEYKSPGDRLNFASLEKVLGYAMLYASYHSNVSDSDITITLVRADRPAGLLKTLRERGCSITSPAPGVYDVAPLALRIPVRIIVSSELSAADCLWLRALNGKLDRDTLFEVLQASVPTQWPDDDRNNIDAVLEVVCKTNEALIEAMKKEEESMTEVLRRIMKPEIDAALYRAEKRGKDIGLQEGEVIGLRKGVAQSVREFIVRMLKKGTFSHAEIAELADVSSDEVIRVARQLHLN